MNRKSIITAVVLVAGFCQQAAAESVKDTLVINDVDRVKIETSDTVQRIVISGARDDKDFHYVQRISIPDTSAVRRKLTSVKDFNKISISGKKGEKKSVEGSFHVLLGMGTMVSAPSDFKFKVWPSWEIGIMAMADWHPFGKRNIWSIGLGIDWRNFRMDTEKYLVKNADGEMVLTPFADDQTEREVSIGVFSLQIPLMYTHRFDDKGKFFVSLGAIVNFNTSATANRSFEYKEEEYEVSRHGTGQRPVTIDGMVVIGIPDFLDVYCKYSPTTFYKSGRGPKMHQLTFGLYF